MKKNILIITSIVIILVLVIVLVINIIVQIFTFIIYYTIEEEITPSKKLTMEVQKASKDKEIIRLSDFTDFEWDVAIIKGTDNIEQELPVIIFYKDEQIVMEYKYSMVEISYHPWGATVTNDNDYFEVLLINGELNLKYTPDNQ